MRQFLCDAFPDKSGRLVLKGRSYKYLVKVLRFSEGASLDARLPDGRLLPFSVEKIDKASAVLRLLPAETSSCRGEGGSNDVGLCSASDSSFDPACGKKKTTQGVQASEVESLASEGPELWLFQFLPKPQKMDLIIRQATECGVKRIVPIQGDYSVKNDASGRMERWERIVKEARQQCGSAVATEIKEVVGVEAAAAMWKKLKEEIRTGEETAAFLLDENPSVGKTCFTGINKKIVAAAALAVGCEGGMSDGERELLKEAGFMPLHFVTNVLRAETAALYGIAVIQQFFSAD